MKYDSCSGRARSAAASERTDAFAHVCDVMRGVCVVFLLCFSRKCVLWCVCVRECLYKIRFASFWSRALCGSF